MDITKSGNGRCLTAGLLIGGTALVYVGLCILWFGADFIAYADASPQRRMAIVFEHATAWQGSLVLVMAGVLVTIFGLAMFTRLLHEMGDRTLSWLGLIAFLFGAVLFVISMAFSFSVTVWAAQEVASGSAIPVFYEPLARWTSDTLLGIYTTLAFFAMAAYGGAVLQTRLLPRWVGWSAIAWSVVWLGTFFLTLVSVPVLQHVMPLVIGVLLLTSRHRVPVGLPEQARTIPRMQQATSTDEA